MGFFDPDLSAAGAAALKTKMVITSSGPCAGMTLVNPSNKAGSPILKRVEGTMCGTQMPSGMPPLPADQIACLADWVNAQ